MNIYHQRVEKIVKEMKNKGLQGVLLFPSPNMYYLTGFHSHPGERLFLAIIPVEGEPFFVAPQMFGNQIKADSWIQELVLWTDDENPYNVLKTTLEKKSMSHGVFAVDDTMWAMQLLSIMNTLTEAKFVKLDKLVSSLRIIKSATEIQTILESSRIVDEVVNVMRYSVKPKMSETEIAALIEQEMKKRGVSEPSFPTIAATGPNSALPHHNTGGRRIEPGEFLLIDFGGIYKGYCSDTTRTLCLGQPSDKMRQVYSIVQEAQEIGVQTVKPGIKASEIDLEVRKYISSRGYGEYFTHRTGHGLGLEVHEEPYITGVSDTVLKPGMVFSIEPGIYLEGEFGVRIEDIVVVTEKGCERLNNSPHDLIQILI